MRIKYIYVNNFRGIDNFSISDLSSNSLIIGKNDAGKTNICYAIRKILDYEVRKVPFDEADSSNSNKQEIKISLILNTENISIDNRSILGTFVDRNNDITLELNAVFNEEIMQYEEKFFIGSIDKKEFATNRSTPIDRVLDLIYINPNYNLLEDKNKFFKFRNTEDKENNIGLTDRVVEGVEHLNEVISNEQVVKDIDSTINGQAEFAKVFNGIRFKTQSNINATNIYKSLEIIPYDDQNSKYNNIGDGKTKTLSFLLNYISKKTDKQRILVVEEPENHLYPQLQRTYSQLIDSLQFDQVLVTTHSPSIIDFRKTKAIIKLYRTDAGLHYNSLNIKEDDIRKYGHMLNEEFAQMLFFDNVLLVEGYSEKYFYNRLMIEEIKFLDFATKKNFGVFCVGGIDFIQYKLFLKKLKINVIVKTDNDIFKVQRSNPLTYRYAGIERVLGYLDDEGLSILKSIINVEEIDPKIHFRFTDFESRNIVIEQNLELIQNLFDIYGVYISTHNLGFEKDFLDFIDMDTPENLPYLKESKLKNLHVFIHENNISLKINDRNKNSILVRFLNV